MSSNDLSQIRGYIKSIISSNYPLYKEWGDSLANIGNIPRTILDKSYHINIREGVSTSQSDKHIEDSFNVILTIFKQAFNSQVVARDEILQVANCIRLHLINPRNIEDYKSSNDGNIEEIKSVSISSSEIDISNDNILKVEIEINVRLFLGVI